MPHASVNLKPGIDVNETPALNEAAISSSQLIRFIPDRNGIGLIQKLGGWIKFFPYQISRIVRSLWAWEDIDSNARLAFGTENDSNFVTQLGLISGDGSALQDITPYQFIDNVTPNFSSTSGSAIINVVDSNIPDASVFGSVNIQTQISIGGVVLFGMYQCVPAGYGGGGAFEIVSTDILGNLLPATSTSTTATLPLFSVVSGSSTVNVTLNNHGFVVGSTFPVLTETVVGGITFVGNYIVQTVNNANSFVITANTIATSTATGNLNNNQARIIFNFGTGVQPASSGYGVGAYGDGPYGVGPSYTSVFPGFPISARDWTLDNWGEILIACPSTPPVVLPVTGYVLPSPVVTGATVVLKFAQSIFIDVGTSVTVAGFNPPDINGTYVTVQQPSVATFTGSISGTTLTVASVSSGTIAVGQILIGTGVYPNTIIIGGSGTSWVVSISQSVTSTTINSVLQNAIGIQLASNIATPLTTLGTITVNNTSYQPIYQWNPQTFAPTATVIPNAPPVNTGVFVAMPQRQLIAYGSTETGILDPLLVRWSDVGNFNVWSATVTNQAGSYRVTKGSRIVGAIQGPQQAIILTDIGCWSMQYIGPPYVYSFNELGTGCGLIAKKAIASIGGVVYWMGPSQFFSLTGAGVQPVFCPIWDVIFQDLDQTNLDKIRVAVNSRFGEITWYYPTTGNSGEINAYAKLNTVLMQWDYGTLGRSAWIDQSILGAPIGFDPNSKYVYQHEESKGNYLFNADTQAMSSSFRTGWFALSEGDVKTFVDQWWPDMKFGLYGGNQNAAVNLIIYAADYPTGPQTAYGPYLLTSSTTFFSPRVRGRLISLYFYSNDLDSFWRIGNNRYRFQQDGKF